MGFTYIILHEKITALKDETVGPVNQGTVSTSLPEIKQGFLIEVIIVKGSVSTVKPLSYGSQFRRYFLHYLRELPHKPPKNTNALKLRQTGLIEGVIVPKNTKSFRFWKLRRYLDLYVRLNIPYPSMFVKIF